MPKDEFARAQSTRLGVQALLTVMMGRPETAATAIEAKELALQVATEADRLTTKMPALEQHLDSVYRLVEDLFMPVSTLQKRDS